VPRCASGNTCQSDLLPCTGDNLHLQRQSLQCCMLQIDNAKLHAVQCGLRSVAIFASGSVAVEFCMQNVGVSLGKASVMTTFAVNVTSMVPEDADGTLWDQFSPLSKLLTIACVNNKAQFEDQPNVAVRPRTPACFPPSALVCNRASHTSVFSYRVMAHLACWHMQTLSKHEWFCWRCSAEGLPLKVAGLICHEARQQG
jgi:hypothetical protein